NDPSSEEHVSSVGSTRSNAQHRSTSTRSVSVRGSPRRVVDPAGQRQHGLVNSAARKRASTVGGRMGVYNHTGQVVTDLERAKRFYQEVLGFKFWYEIAPPDEATSKLNCL